jgi:hypothetical protein
MDMNLYIKLSSLPDNLKKEVEDFVDFLKAKATLKKKGKPSRKAGLAKGLIHMKKNFDEPLVDFKEYME